MAKEKLPEVVVRKLWQLTKREPRKAYTTRRASPTLVEVLEQGSKVLHRAKVTANDNARYTVEGGWLLERTYPAAVQRVEQAAAAASVASAARRKASTAATREPVFQMLLGQLTSVLGAPTKVRACNVGMWSFPCFASDDDFVLWQGRARHAGAALTQYASYRGSSVRLVAGRVSRFGALFGEDRWLGDARIEAVFDALDDDAGLVIDHVEHEGDSFQLRLNRVPRTVARHATALAKIFGGKSAAVAAALRKRAWCY